ncbi:hypothetical protein HRI_004928600 [Hibiscus trionum]|uniref:Uncharacterized protein n=1 Tax=Hibiscus trionum TaxID=183268 RepID=A0A9W7MRV4_HIBTR|nr:hypothetical protein HRI_004928600 [Hibiscus trionum]
MAQICLLWCPKKPKSGGEGRGKNGCYCAGLVRILSKLKKEVRSAGASRQSSFQCRYDPLSYSLNFDTSGSGSDEDYHHMYAFSSRFAACSTS